MKKIFTLIAMLAGTMSAMAVDYTDEMAILLNGEGPYVSQSTVSVEEIEGTDGEYNITLKQFSFNGLPIGDVMIKNVKGDDDTDGNTWFETEQDAEISNGGPVTALLGGKVHVTIKEGSRMKDGKLYLVISLPVPLDPSNPIDVSATFGTGGYQIPNSGFENFHKAHVSSPDGDTAESDEPDAWHSFMSASGVSAFVYLAGYNPHTFISEDTRPGSYGNRSVEIRAIDMFLAIANGTITTGRLNTGSYDATDVKSNYSWNDMSQTEVDENGDPFYAVMNGKPDALVAWVKFSQGMPNAEHPYATISAVINDGMEYHDPEDKTYTNVVAKAVNNKIETTGGEWTKLEIPFDYASYEQNNAVGKAILVTISTNADAGKGSDNDQLFVDDIALIYNSKLESLKVKGTDVQGFSKDVMDYDLTLDGTVSVDDIEAVSDGRGAYVRKAIETVDGGVKATVTVISNDWKDTNVYTLNISGATTGINKVVTSEANGGVAVYNINGQRTYSTAQKGLYIIRKADGTTVKVIRK